MPKPASDGDVAAGGGQAAPSAAHILICDDDAELRQLLSAFLGDHGYFVLTAGDGRELERVIASGVCVDLVILDVMMPGVSGREACQRLRKTSHVPVLMLSALADEVDRVVGLEIGADDYMAKPFGPAELLARVKALLRRSRLAADAAAPPHGRPRDFEFEGWRLDPARRELRNPAGVIIDLSAGEFDLLLAFVEAPQRVLSRDHLMDAARNRAPAAFDRSIDVQVSRLRRKIGSTDETEGFIKTVRGAGYMFVPAVRRT